LQQCRCGRRTETAALKQICDAGMTKSSRASLLCVFSTAAYSTVQYVSIDFLAIFDWSADASTLHFSWNLEILTVSFWMVVIG
jgi:hypothetical protein